MNNDRIANLNEKKSSIENRIKELSKGKDTEVALKKEKVYIRI